MASRSTFARPRVEAADVLGRKRAIAGIVRSQGAQEGGVASARSAPHADRIRIAVQLCRVRLQPANSEMQPIYVDPRDLRIQGKVVSVIRAVE